MQVDFLFLGERKRILFSVGAGGIEDLRRGHLFALENGVGHFQTSGDGRDGGARRRLLELRHLEGGAVEAAAAAASTTTAKTAAGVGVGHGAKLLKIRDGDHRHGAILGCRLLRRQKIRASRTQGIIGGAASASTPTAASASAPGRRGGCLLRSQFGGQTGHHHDLAVYIEALVGIRPGLVDHVAVTRKNQARIDLQRIHLRSAPAGGHHRPILAIRKFRGARTGRRACAARSTAASATAASSTTAAAPAPGNGSLALIGHDLPAD